MLKLSARPAACAENDADCMCMEALRITNEIRAKVGKGPVMVGPKNMLRNAANHSKAMSDYLGMEHQDLGEAAEKVGCDIFMNRENVAWYNGMDVDPAVQLSGKIRTAITRIL